MSLITKILPINKSDDIGSLSNEDLNLHDCLTDDADWDDEYWDFYQNCIGGFSGILRRTYDASTKGIKFQAIWAGEEPDLSIELTIEQLLNTLTTNKVSTRAVYIINKNT